MRDLSAVQQEALSPLSSLYRSIEYPPTVQYEISLKRGK